MISCTVYHRYSRRHRSTVYSTGNSFNPVHLCDAAVALPCEASPLMQPTDGAAACGAYLRAGTRFATGESFGVRAVSMSVYAHAAARATVGNYDSALATAAQRRRVGLFLRSSRGMPPADPSQRQRVGAYNGPLITVPCTHLPFARNETSVFVSGTSAHDAREM